MSDLYISLRRLNDTVLLGANLRLDIPKRAVKYNVSFNPLHRIVSTSEGAIDGDSIVGIRSVLHINFSPEENINTLFATVAYLGDQDELVSYEMLTATVDIPASKPKERPSPNLSDWYFKLELDQDLMWKVHKFGKPAMFALGEPSEHLLASDFVFPIETGRSSGIIPIEVLQSKVQFYKGNEIRLYVLRKASSLPYANIYYKHPASNAIKLSDCHSILSQLESQLPWVKRT